mgnify:CR=1 FL=1
MLCGMEKNERIQELEALIKRHQNLYYNAEPEISDADFDALWDELRSLDPRNTLFATVPQDSANGRKRCLSPIFWCNIN